MKSRDSTTEELHLGHLVTILRRWWWLVVVVVALCIAVAYAALERVTPRYRAVATVVVSSKAPRILADVKEIVDLPDGGGRRDFGEYAETQLDIIRSQSVATAVLDKLDLWHDPRLFEPPEEATETEDADTLRLKRSASLAKRVIAQRVPESLVMHIGFENEDAKLATALANEFASAYVRQNLLLKRGVLDRASGELRTLLQQRLAAKQAAEAATRKFENEHRIAVVGTRRKEVEGERGFYNSKVLEATGLVVASRAMLDNANKAETNRIFVKAVPQVLSHPVLNQLKVKYVDLKNEVAQLKLVYGPKHTKLTGAINRRNQVARAIRLETKGILESTRARFEAATQQQADYQLKFQAARAEDETLSRALEEYGSLTKTQAEETALYDRIRKRHEETLITAGLAEAANNVRILDSALVPKVPIWPRRVPILVGAGMFGLLLGLLLVMLLDRADTTIRSKEHVEVVLDVPCLGVVPSIEQEGEPVGIEGARIRDLYVFHNSTSESAEQARTLRTNLLFLSAERQLKTIMITSGAPEEGKTTVVAQTGIILAATGSRTVLVEADLRRPRLAATLGVESDFGVSTFLAGRNVELNEIVQRTEVDNMDVVVCGLIPPNPAELLNSLRLNQLIAKLEEQYDMVIVDSPPVNVVSDALVMASRVDGVLIVCKSQRTTTEELRSAYRALANIEAPVLGTVLNDLSQGRIGYYRSGKYYRRGYYPRRLDAELMEPELESQAEVG